MVVLDKPLKNLGVHPVKVRLHAEVVVTITINIARSQDEAERQARGENVIASQYEEDRLADEEAAADMAAGGAGSHEVDFGADR
jgi:large subunit ribosomal protein L9